MAEVIRQSASQLQLNELESIAGLSFRALEASNHEVRCAVAQLLGQSAAAALAPARSPPAAASASSSSAAAAAAAAAAATPEASKVPLFTGFSFFRIIKNLR